MEIDGGRPGVASGRRWARWAAVWAFLFAGLSLYWVMGGRLGVNQLGIAIQERAKAHDPDLFRLLWVSVAVKALLGVLALGLGRIGDRRVARLLLLAAWCVGVGLALYGGGGMVQAALVKAGLIDAPTSQGEAAAIWYLLLWEPIWLAGGALFLMAARRTRLPTPQHPPSPVPPPS